VVEVQLLAAMVAQRPAVAVAQIPAQAVVARTQVLEAVLRILDPSPLVPEPSSITMLLLGAAGLLFGRTRLYRRDRK
jgi:hypothetical protein